SALMDIPPPLRDVPSKVTPWLLGKSPLSSTVGSILCPSAALSGRPLDCSACGGITGKKEQRMHSTLRGHRRRHCRPRDAAVARQPSSECPLDLERRDDVRPQPLMI